MARSIPWETKDGLAAAAERVPGRAKRSCEVAPLFMRLGGSRFITPNRPPTLPRLQHCSRTLAWGTH